jgi:Ca-activated chloride channel family protein
MFDRLTKKTGFYAMGAAAGAAIAEMLTEWISAYPGEAQNAARMIAHTALWMGSIALGLSLALLIAQNLYLKRAPGAEAVVKTAAIGLASGAVAGGLAQILYGGLVDTLPFAAARVFQAFCWGLAGLGVGWGVSLFVPNYPARRAILAGFSGGVAGGAAFVLLYLLGLPEAPARVIGLALLGAAIGLTLSAVEEILREAWLTVIWGRNETSSVSLGQNPVVLGSASEADVHLPRAKFPPVTAILTVENAQVMLDNRLNDQKIALPNGSKINIGRIAIVVHTRKSAADRERG